MDAASNERIQLGHWEADTVVGLRNRKETVVFTLVERVTDNYIAMQVPSKTKAALQGAMQMPGRMTRRSSWYSQDPVRRPITPISNPSTAAFGRSA